MTTMTQFLGTKTEKIKSKRGNIMKKASFYGLLGVLLIALTACTAGPNTLVNSENQQGNVAGFWQGLWHGFIILFTFLVSMFNPNVSIYEVHNNGGWYNFGFLLGVMIFFGGSGGSSSAYHCKR